MKRNSLLNKDKGSALLLFVFVNTNTICNPNTIYYPNTNIIKELEM